MNQIFNSCFCTINYNWNISIRIISQKTPSPMFFEVANYDLKEILHPLSHVANPFPPTGDTSGWRMRHPGQGSYLCCLAVRNNICNFNYQVAINSGKILGILLIHIDNIIFRCYFDFKEEAVWLPFVYFLGLNGVLASFFVFRNS